MAVGESPRSVAGRPAAASCLQVWRLLPRRGQATAPAIRLRNVDTFPQLVRRPTVYDRGDRSWRVAFPIRVSLRRLVAAALFDPALPGARLAWAELVGANFTCRQQRRAIARNSHRTRFSRPSVEKRAAAPRAARAAHAAAAS